MAFKVGDKVRFIGYVGGSSDDEMHPPIGTVGLIVGMSPTFHEVEFDAYRGKLYFFAEELELVESASK